MIPTRLLVSLESICPTYAGALASENAHVSFKLSTNIDALSLSLDCLEPRSQIDLS